MAAASQPSRGARVAVGALYACLPTAACLVLAELVCAGLGLGNTEIEDSRGFDPEARYLLPDPEQPSGHITQFYDGDDGEERVPARGDAQRVMLFGGSNTQGFPEEYLERLLEKRLGRDIDVFNLGREGYGSGRVSILFPQGLELGCDLAVVYSGHNEFVEAGFAQEVSESRTGASAAAAARLRGLRTFRALEQAFAPDPELQSTPTPEAFKADDRLFRELDYADTIARMEQFERNLEHIVADATAREVPVVLVTTIGNYFCAPNTWTAPRGTDAQLAADQETRLQAVLAALPDPTRAAVRIDPRERLRRNDWLETPEALPDGYVPPRLRDALPPHQELKPYWKRPENWTDRAMEHMANLDALLHAPLADGEEPALREALAELDAILLETPDHPLAHYLTGLILHRLNEDDRGAEHLARAALYDRAPRKTSRLQNDVVRKVAAAHASEDVHLIDLEAAWAERYPGGIFGYEVMWDICHMHALARRRLIEDLVPDLASQLED